MRSRRLDRVVRALSSQRAAKEQSLAQVERERTGLVNQLESIDARLARTQAELEAGVFDAHLRMVADRATQRLNRQADHLRTHIDQFDDTRFEPVREETVQARIQLKTVELLAARRVQAHRALRHRADQALCDEAAIRGHRVG